MSAIPKLKITLEEYLEQEELSLEKNEFYKGEIFAMAGASLVHNQIVSNAHLEIGSFLRGKKCRIFMSDLKINCKANSLITYPDLSIVCGKIETLERNKNIVTNPTVIIEVLSKATQNYDRGDKFKLYRDIASLKEYILISSEEMLIEKYVKQSDTHWLFYEYNNENPKVKISTIDFEIEIKDFYRDVEWK